MIELDRTTSRISGSRSMIVGLGLGLLTMVVASGFQDPPKTDTRPDARTLVGEWKVDLRPTPDAPAYDKPFIVKSVNGNTFEGTFYGTELKNGRINRDWGAVRFAFTTEDQSGPYNHSGTLKGDRLEGLTHSLGRNFLAVWSAVRVKPEAAPAK